MMKYSERSLNFFEDVYDVVRLIPEGRLTSYGAIAAYLGSAGSARMVGWAMNASHRIEGLSAHRVLNRQGMLTGKMHFEHPMYMQEMLEKEGHVIENDLVTNFEEVFWDPQIELTIE